MKENVIFFYTPGARGDFLASLIFNKLEGQHSWHINTVKIVNPYMNYVKVHDLNTKFFDKDPLVTIDELILNRSYRIRLNTFSDYLTCMYYVQEKINLPDTQRVSVQAIWSLLKQEAKYKKLDNFFNEVIDFSNLYDVDFLKDFYRRFHGHEFLDQTDLDRVRDNINLNPVITLGNYKKYLNIDIEDIKTIYEQTTGISTS